MKDKSKLRHLYKSISWRIIASITTAIIATLYGLPSQAIGFVFFTDLVIKFVMYYFHERFWYTKIRL